MTPPQPDLFGYVPLAGVPPAPPLTPPAPESLLINLFGPDDGETLILTRLKTKGSVMEVVLLRKIQDMMTGWTLENFVIYLNDWLKNTYMGNSCQYWLFYTISSNDEFAEIWHNNAEGNRDRHVCTVTKPTEP